MTPTELDEWCESLRQASIVEFMTNGKIETKAYVLLRRNPDSGKNFDAPQVCLVAANSDVQRGALFHVVQQTCLMGRALGVCLFDEFNPKSGRKFLMCNYERQGHGEIWAAYVLSPAGVMAYQKSHESPLGLLATD